MLNDSDIAVRNGGKLLPHSIARSSRFSEIDGQKPTISKDKNVNLFLLFSDLNQAMVSSEFRHWFADVCCRISMLILSKMVLLTLSRSVFAGFIKRHFGWLSKSSLWSFSEIKVCVSAIGSMRFAIFSSSAMSFISWLMLSIMPACANL